MSTLSSAGLSDAAEAPASTAVRRWRLPAIGIGLFLLLLLGLPLHLCMPLWVDVTVYDLAARNILQGGVHYRDLFENNLPGIVWAHVAIRGLFGWSSLALTTVDAVIVAVIVLLLTNWLRPLRSPAFRLATAALLVFFYFSTSESTHCQRDTWMLLPVLVALHLRRHQVTALTAPHACLGRAGGWSLLEGLCWGAACWLKPWVVVPGLACWAASAVLVAARAPQPWRRLAADAGGLLLGGLTAGGLGVAWLYWSGSWPYFVDLFSSWNSSYYGVRFPLDWRLKLFVKRFPGWVLIHAVAVPLALRSLWWTLRSLKVPDNRTTLVPDVLLSALYLGWLYQALVLQHPFDYVYVPVALLALTLIARCDWLVGWPALRQAMVLGFLILVAVLHPLFRPARLAAWPLCWREGSSAAVRDRLAFHTDVPQSTRWVELERLARELRERGVQDGELVCYSLSSVPLYLELNLKPPTPYVQYESLRFFFGNRARPMLEQLQATPYRYLVTDYRIPDLSVEQASAQRPGSPLAPPPDFRDEWTRDFPWNQPVVERVGPYALCGRPPGSAD